MRYRLNVVEKSLRDQRWQIVGFGIAFLAMAALIVYIWPSYRTTVASIQLPEAVQAFLGSDLAYSTAPGFVSAEYFSWIPILLIVYTVIQGTGAIAGEEGSGTIDLLMAQPITRAEMVLQKTVAVCIGSALDRRLRVPGLSPVDPVRRHRDHAEGRRAGVGEHAADHALVLRGLAVVRLGAAESGLSRPAARSALATAGYFFNTIATAVDSLSWLKYASPFYYYGAGLPLVKGIDWSHVSLLARRRGAVRRPHGALVRRAATSPSAARRTCD